MLRKLVESTKTSAGEDFEDLVPAPLTTTDAMDDMCTKIIDRGYRKKRVRTFKHRSNIKCVSAQKEQIKII